MSNYFGVTNENNNRDSSNIEDFELSDDSDCEYETNRRRLHCYHNNNNSLGRTNQYYDGNGNSIDKNQGTTASAMKPISSKKSASNEKNCTTTTNSTIDNPHVKDKEHSMMKFFTGVLQYRRRKVIAPMIVIITLLWVILCHVQEVQRMNPSSLSYSNSWERTAVHNKNKKLYMQQNQNPTPNLSQSPFHSSDLDTDANSYYAMLADLYTPFDMVTDVPLLWNIPSGGTDTLQELIVECYANPNNAGDLGRINSHGDVDTADDDEVEVLTGADVLHDVTSVIEMDISVVKGRPKDHDITKSTVWPSKKNYKSTVLISSPSLPLVASLFTDKKRGRLFTILRNPIHRIVDEYYNKYLAIASKNAIFTNDDNIGGMNNNNQPSSPVLTLEQYVLSQEYCVDNWITRTLTNNLNPIYIDDAGSKGVPHKDLNTSTNPDRLEEATQRNNAAPILFRQLDRDTLNFAKEVLRRKCLVGVDIRLGDFIERMERFFQWNDETHYQNYQYNAERNKNAASTTTTTPPPVPPNDSVKEKITSCRNSVITNENEQQNNMHYDYPQVGTDLYRSIYEQNKWDMELYAYARDVLFDKEQGNINFKLSRPSRSQHLTN